MKSIKPGRGPSAMGTIGSIAAAVFGVFWVIMASSMGAPTIFPLFGVVFIVIAIVQAVYNYKNATGENRMSLYDIAEEGEEADPIHDYIRGTKSQIKNNTRDPVKYEEKAYCPYCGRTIKEDFVYCPICGRDLE